MIATSDFRRGSTKILWNDEPWLVVEFQHVKPGKGGAFVRTKMKNLITNRLQEETFRSGEKFPAPDLELIQVQYLYADDQYNFLDQGSYEQLAFSAEQIDQVKDYLKQDAVYTMLKFKGEPISIEAPNFMVLTVTSTVPGVKGNTAQGGSKPATLETGVVVNVPLFVNEGESIKVDTRDGSYIERV
ncbi:MAG: elongation factor [Candidatus Dependentiae bacterium]|nr:elongation factor [Candidatus Dependentiae bacterium]